MEFDENLYRALWTLAMKRDNKTVPQIYRSHGGSKSFEKQKWFVTIDRAEGGEWVEASGRTINDALTNALIQTIDMVIDETGLVDDP